MGLWQDEGMAALSVTCANQLLTGLNHQLYDPSTDERYQRTNLSTHKLTNLKTHQLVNLETHNLISLQPKKPPNPAD